jgi:hypothetical protein
MYSSNCTLWYMQAALAGGKTEAKRGDQRRRRMSSDSDHGGVVTDAEASAEARRQQGAAPTASPGSRYAIRVEGHLGTDWSGWLEGMSITHEAGGLTRLEGAFMDQAALHGLLNKLRDLRLTIVTLERLSADDPAAPSSLQPPESTA